MGNKGTKSVRYCVDAMRSKMTFDSEESALKFIEWNGDEMEAKTGFKPVRAYYCHCCQGWHVTKHGNEEWYRERNEKNAEVADVAKEQGGGNTGYSNFKKKNKRYLNKSYQDLIHSIRRNAGWKRKKACKKRFGNRDNWKDEI